MARHHRPLTAYMIGLCQVWHARMALGQHTRSNDVGRRNLIS